MSRLVALIVVALLLPGLALLIAVVIRFAFRGVPRPPANDARDESDAGT